MDALQTARQQIDEIDREMAALFERRMAEAAKIAAYKKQRSLPLQDAAREGEVIGRGAKWLNNPSLQPLYAEFMTHLLSLSRQYQARLTQGDTP